MWFSRKKTKPPFTVGVDQIDGVIDPLSATWKALENWARLELQAARERNDHARNDAIKTALIRGEIARLKKILALPNEPGNRLRKQRPPILAGRSE